MGTDIITFELWRYTNAFYVSRHERTKEFFKDHNFPGVAGYDPLAFSRRSY